MSCYHACAYSLLLLFIFGVAVIYNLYSINYYTRVTKKEFKIVPIIMAWTPWFSVSFVELFRPILEKCPLHCRIVKKNESTVLSADALLFHARNFDGTPPNRIPNQLYVVVNLESPYNLGHNLNGLDLNFFNASMTYKSDSTYPYPYGAFTPYTSDSEDRWNKLTKRVMKRKKLAVTFNSNCQTNSKREVYIRELANHTQISLHGSCYNSSVCSNRANADCMEGVLNQHLFYLAFENSVCNDYTTEKFFRAARLQVVPIVLRRSAVSPYAPKDSFLAADNFANVADLADHLEYLDRNRTAYLQYLKWTNHYYIQEYPSINICKLCEDLHNGERIQSHNFANQFTKSSQCAVNFALNIL